MQKSIGRVLLACVCALAGTTYFFWRSGTAGAVTSSPQIGSTVRGVPRGQRPRAAAGEKGATYEALARRTRKLTTRFADAVAVAERTADGDIRALLRDTAGREIGRLVVDHIDASTDALRFTDDAGTTFEALGERNIRMTMDWANRQVYGLAKDRVGSDVQNARWRGGFIRAAGAPDREFEREILELETQWDEGLTAVTSRRPAARRRPIAGREVAGELVVTRLTKDGQQAGLTNWFPREQVFTWDLPGLTRGAITAKELEKYGGWTFTPDLEWMNVQAIAFHHFKSVIDKQRFVAARRPGLWDKTLQFFLPVVAANEPGCDELHWLDDTVFRFCCDIHDQCYEKYGCSASSWWKFWTSWKCDACNAFAIWCFANPMWALMYS